MPTVFLKLLSFFYGKHSYFFFLFWNRSHPHHTHRKFNLLKTFHPKSCSRKKKKNCSQQIFGDGQGLLSGPVTIFSLHSNPSLPKPLSQLHLGSPRFLAFITCPLNFLPYHQLSPTSWKLSHVCTEKGLFLQGTLLSCSECSASLFPDTQSTLDGRMFSSLKLPYM